MSGSFYVVGGFSDGAESIIGRFDLTSEQWTEAGDLAAARRGHNIIYDGNYLLVIGGGGNYMSEKCSIGEDGQVTTCTSQTPQLDFYAWYPELLFVPADYCRQELT